MEIIHEKQINYMQVCSAYILFKSNSESVYVNEHLLCCITYEHSLLHVFYYDLYEFLLEYL